MGRGDEKDPGKPGRGAAMLGRMQRTNKERPFLQHLEFKIHLGEDAFCFPPCLPSYFQF